MKSSQYSSPVFTLTAAHSIHDALIMMKSNFIKRVVVVKEKKAIGILTERDISRFLEQDTTKRSLSEISLKEIMKKDLITIMADQGDLLSQCAARMVTFKIGSIIVTDENADLIGIVTQTDIARAFAGRYPGKYKVRDYMSEKAVTCRDSDYLRYALEILNKNDVSRLVVTDKSGHVKGTITTNTFLTNSDYFKQSNGVDRKYLLGRESFSQTVNNLIGKEILVVEPDYDLANTAHLMIQNNISGIPVIADSFLVGVITKFDVVRAFCDVPVHKDVLEKYSSPT